jgi:hypothetical protein
MFFSAPCWDPRSRWSCSWCFTADGGGMKEIDLPAPGHSRLAAPPAGLDGRGYFPYNFLSQ